MTLRLPDPCLVVLVGATGAGKSAWAGAWFQADQIVSSDRLRAVVGAGERDQRASRDAFELLDLIVAKRLRRGLTTVVDTTGLEPKRRAAWLALAEREGVPAYAVVVDTPEKTVRERNRARGAPVPAKVVAAQLREAAGAREALAGEGFAGVFRRRAGRARAARLPGRPGGGGAPGRGAAAARVRPPALALRGAGEGATADALAGVARAAEEAGFTSLWLMDHFLQIPQVGREWEDMLESYTTLGYLAGVTGRIRLGTLVTGVTYRNLGHLGKIVATLDVAVGRPGLVRARAGSFDREHGPTAGKSRRCAERYARLEDALELLPLLWGPGAPRFEGRTTVVAEATVTRGRCRSGIPILVGGAGERQDAAARGAARRRLQPVRRPATVRHKLAVLRAHCAAAGRDPAEIAVTHLAPARVVAAGEPREGQGAASVEEHVGRYRELAEAGVQTAIVGLSDAPGPGSVTRFADVIAASRGA